MRVIPLLVLVAMTTRSQADVTLGHDATLLAGNNGNVVVEAVVNRLGASCIFDDDKQYLRRLAYVETNDGLSPNTYRDDYHGGLWKMDKKMFDETQSSMASVYMSSHMQRVQSYFGINWLSVKWEDLRKPLYSGLGARLYTEFMATGKAVPRSIKEQSVFYTTYYRKDGSAQSYTDLSKELEKGCNSTKNPDMVFALDGSGSIGSYDFDKILEFVKDVVSSYDIGPDKTRIGVIKFSSAVTVEFQLDTYNNKADVLKAIDSISYRGGGTNTHLALDAMTDVLFTVSNGARSLDEGHPRVGVMLTDGQSSSATHTVASAERAHAADITIFTIGVGHNVDQQELAKMSSPPVCLHLFLLSGFNEIAALTTQIEMRTCQAPVIFQPLNYTIEDNLLPGEDQNCKIKVPKEGATIQIITTEGGVAFYTARSTYPSSSYYEQKAEAYPGKPGLMYVGPTYSGIVFCNYQGLNLTGGSNISIDLEEGEVDNCKPSPCGDHGASCASTLNDYTCTCKEGWEGNNCSDKVDPCRSSPCDQGDCATTADGYQCTCKPGYVGKQCQEEKDECESSPCQNGTCKNLINIYKCDCTAGYSGTNCEINTNECASSPCKNGACQDKDNSYTCVCQAGWTGTHCTEDQDECASDPCLQGRCENKQNKYTCICKDGWGGVNCNEPADECASNPCGHGKCQTIHNAYECCCDDGWTGKLCNDDIDECESNPCVNGDCANHDNHYKCKCKPGWTGVHCEIDVDECKSDPCVNGECTDKINGYKCKCLPGWDGTNCDEDIDECKSDPCVNGQCVDKVNGFTCSCEAGWTGKLCQTGIDECKSNPCFNGDCEDKINSYVCKCQPGWEGTHCNENIDECESNPCVHGECKDYLNRYQCVCHPGYTGVNCESEVNECLSDPCVHGKCDDHVNKYVCQCEAGWTATNCDDNIDECASDPCEHGSCSDLVNGYKCSCMKGWTGTHCDCVENSCESNPCKNGICENTGPNKFKCICMHGHSGVLCENSAKPGGEGSEDSQGGSSPDEDAQGGMTTEDGKGHKAIDVYVNDTTEEPSRPQTTLSTTKAPPAIAVSGTTGTPEAAPSGKRQMQSDHAEERSEREEHLIHMLRQLIDHRRRGNCAEGEACP